MNASRNDIDAKRTVNVRFAVLRRFAAVRWLVALKRSFGATLLIALGVIPGLAACQGAPPMSKARFSEAAKRCGLQATTYTFRDGILLDEPLIDFSREREPAHAQKCFDDALDRIDREMTERGVEQISYIWESRT